MKYITTYNQNWSRRFLQITAYLKKFLSKKCTYHHVGSTSIPGMVAKDIIDLDIEYLNCSLQGIIDGLKEAGYEHQGDLGIPGREAFKQIQGSVASSLPSHHLYACEVNAYELQKHITFRDYLIANPVRARWLSNQKLSVDASAHSRIEYIEKKSCYYEVITLESMAWANNSCRCSD